MKKLAFLVAVLLYVTFTAFADGFEFSVSGTEGVLGGKAEVYLSMTAGAAAGSLLIEYDYEKLDIANSEFSGNFDESGINPHFPFNGKQNQIKLSWVNSQVSAEYPDFCVLTFNIREGANGEAYVKFIEEMLEDEDKNIIELNIPDYYIKINGNSDLGAGDSENSDSESGGNSEQPPSDSGRSGGGRTPANTVTVQPEKNETPPQPDEIDVSSEEDAPPSETANCGAPPFTDLTGFEWAEDSINSLFDAGIINGISPNEFEPYGNITRADFTLLIARMLGLENEISDNFSDVSENMYYYNEIGKAKAAGIISGIGENKFAPEENITRQDLFTLAFRAFDFSENEVENSTFDDRNEISEYARTPISVLFSKGLVAGGDNKIYPKNFATRAETAVFLYRIYKLTE